MTDILKANANNRPEHIKVFGYYVPLYPEEVPSFNDDVHLLAKARKEERKMRKVCELKFTPSKPVSYYLYLYFASLSCLQAQMLEANKRRRVKDRLSLRQIIEGSKQYKVAIELDEPVNVYNIPKLSGTGLRTINDFGPVARGAQRMALTLLRMAFDPAPFQYTRQSAAVAIKEALRLITEEDYAYVAELDIVSHYPSFTLEALVDWLPLPKSAIMQIVTASSAQWVGQASHSPVGFISNTIHTPPLGIPQGSAASSAVAEFSVSKLKTINVVDTTLINYADNFFLFGKDAHSLSYALEALRLGIAELPGGDFQTHPDKSSADPVQPVTQPFRMLGCHIVKLEDGVDVFPTETNLERLEGRVEISYQKIEATLIEAHKASDDNLRLVGLQEFLRLESYIVSWLAAFSMCTSIDVFRHDLYYRLYELADAFGITEEELEAAKDPSTTRYYYPSSEIAKW